MTVPLSTPSYVHYTGNSTLKVYPIPFPTYEPETIEVYITNLPDWSHIAGDTLGGIVVYDLVLNTDYTLQNVAKPNTSVTLKDASDVPPGWVGPIPERQVWLDADGFLKTGYYIYVEFITNSMRPSTLASGNNLIPALSKDLDRLAMHIKALDHKTSEGFRDFLNLIVTSGGSSPPAGLLPPPIEEGQYLEGNDLLEAAWQSGKFEGFSLRYGTELNLASIRDAFLYIFNFGYIAPTISLSCSPAQTVREKGTVVSAVTMSATTVKKTEDIVAVRHYRNGVLVDTEASPAPGGGVESFVESTPFSDNMSFYSRVDDTTTIGTQSNTVSYPFAYPYYEGRGAAGLNAAGIVANLTKVVRSSTASVPVTSSPTSEHFYFCYPAAYPALTSILDPSSFEILSGFTVRTVTITGLDGTPQSYRVYELTNPTTQVAFTVTYKR